jgi:glycosyltransferase involved in cell wall biosynthesis
MKKKIWIMNHYAINQFFNRGGRHFWFSENLLKRGYEPSVFCANTRHNSEDIVELKSGKFVVDKVDGIPFVFVKTTTYKKNGFYRLKNMISFYKNLFPTARKYASKYGKPDVIIASSVHPLTLIAGIKIAKKFGIPCICEVRDLWPESIVAYGALKKNSLITKLLYKGENWIYQNADSIIMTWEGGKEYIVDQGWEKDIDITKVTHISNGVIVNNFDKNSEEFKTSDPDLDNISYKNIVYAGSIRKVNNLGLLLDAAKLIQEKGHTEIRFLIYGSGDESDSLMKRCEIEGINNVIFKGRVEKKYVPSILKKSYINILHNSSTSLDKYGQSQNKFFEYLAAGKCIVQTYRTGYSICERYNCGINVSTQNSEEIAKAIIDISSDDENCKKMGENARRAAYDFDFGKLTENLINVIERV